MLILAKLTMLKMTAMMLSLIPDAHESEICFLDEVITFLRTPSNTPATITSIVPKVSALIVVKMACRHRYHVG